MSQWKPKRRKGIGHQARAAHQRKRRACRTPPFEVWDAGADIALRFPEDDQGWMAHDDWEKHGRAREQVQMSTCPKTGVTWVKPLVGRHEGEDEEALRERFALLTEMTQLLGKGPSFFGGGPLAFQVEFLENVLEFELRPPCGCPPPAGLAQA